LKIACDIDGVLADVMPLLRKSILEACGYDIDGKVRQYDFYKSIPELQMDAWGDSVDAILSCQKNILPYEESLMYFPFVYSPSTTLITARRKEFIDETRAWFQYYYKMPVSVVSRSSREKLPYLLEHGFNVLIEDRLRTANLAGDHMQVFLINRPWNVGRETNVNVIRVRSFKEIAKMLCK
jgi:hypothetical protein